MSLRSVSLIGYIAIFTAHSVTVKKSSQDEILDAISIIFHAECLKVLLSLGLYVAELNFNFKAVVEDARTSLFKRDWRMIGPALLYTMYNYLTFGNIIHYDPQIYAVLMNVRIGFTAVAWSLIFNKKLHHLVQTSLLVLIAGCMIANTDCSSKQPTFAASFDLSGLPLVLLQASLSSLASVYNELLIKSAGGGRPSLNRQNLILGAMSVLLCAAVSATRSGAPPLLATPRGRQLLLVVLQAAGGLCAAHVLRHFDAVTKVSPPFTVTKIMRP